MDIAVIGIALRLSDIEKVDDFWKGLKKGRDFIKAIPNNRKKDVEEYLQYVDGNIEKLNWENGTYLEHIDYFDNEFFDMPPKDAQYMDPNQRLFLETAWHVIEDAGYSMKAIRGTHTGVFVGYVSESDYRHMIMAMNPSFASIAVPGNCPPLIGGRISHILDLTGPNMLINTVCSSSLVAIHQACESIKNEECHMAIAGGIQLHVLPYRKIKVGVESSNGKTMSFDDDADGTGTGEGVGAVLLKPLHKAIEDKDNIYAVIKGSGINHDGHAIGISAPNPIAQEKLLIDTWHKAGVSPKEITYIEAHGTGTTLGDPIEIASINNAFSQSTRHKQFCGIGSVKSNVGHLDGAAGIMGFIKAVLCLHHKMLVPSIHFNRPNGHIDFCNSSVYVIDRLGEWKKDKGKRLCGVSAFGFSGTNCHVVLEEAPRRLEGCREGEEPFVFTVSAKTESALAQLIKRYILFLNENKQLHFVDVCYTSNLGRNHFKYRFATMASNVEQLIQKLQEYDTLGRTFYKQNGKPHVNAQKSHRIDLDNKLDAMSKYLKGEHIDWSQFYTKIECNKVSMVLYPFKKVRHWLTIPGVNKEVVCDSDNNIRGQQQQQSSIKDAKMVLKDALIEIIKKVLGFEEVDTNCSLLELGGDSIHAMNIADELKKKYNFNMDPIQLINATSLHQLFTSETLCRESESIPLKNKSNKEQYIPLTIQQERIYFSSKIHMNDTQYNMPYATVIKGLLDIDRLQNTLIKIVKRHEALRASFHLVDNKPMQTIHSDRVVHLETADSMGKSIDTLIQEFVKPFQLSKDPLIRFKLINMEKHQYLFLIDIHHIICDGISTNIIIHEFSTLYKNEKLPKLDMDYSTYVKKLTHESEQEIMEKYWMHIYREKCSKTVIPYDFPFDANKKSDSMDTFSKKMDDGLFKKVKSFSKENSISMFELLFSCFNMLIFTYTWRSDMVIGLNVSGRKDVESYPIVGLISNVVPFRNYILSDETLLDILVHTKNKIREVYPYQNYPIEVLAEKTGIYLGAMMRLMFNMIHVERPDRTLDDLEFEPYYIKNRTINNDITWDIFNHHIGLLMVVNYKSNLYRKQTIHHLVQDYMDLIRIIINDGSIRISQLKENSILKQSKIDIPQTKLNL
ncbi:hypothetical protein HZI73_05825 [Vallitalea pronyensis]|uniref:Polyketide synthase n=1 Tax=Vallitalea pronyensis TaxID=1348613 RepID=A0A8J8MHP7_9FIRM|nr:condensation domain-containing protein [Vallitalea pronyensis]QUI21845.1 hypothetical protein HZI73_05825 [Vallitalea pronyensis]